MSSIKNSYVVAVAGMLLLVAFVLHMVQMPIIQGYALIAVTLLTGLPVALKALRSLRVKAFSIELLVAISLVGALIIGEYVEAAALGFLFAAGAWLEARALREIRGSLKRYMDGLAQNVPDPELAVLIADRIEEAQESPTTRQQFLQRFANVYTPAVLVLAVLLYLFSGNIEQVLTLLVIACPGALVISVPAALAAGISNGAHRGILIKDGYALEALAATDAASFTELSVAGANALDTADVLLLADRADLAERCLQAHDLARATLRIMKQNTWFALGTVAILLAGVSLGQLFLAWGMLIHEVSVLLVILNAARLIRYKSSGKLLAPGASLWCKPVA
ncbi:cation-translocating P-type ATPase [Alcaligenaceae bacterium]|nr:cation-translocating P-type ATPase [Alcaligenaceae bacterium]